LTSNTHWRENTSAKQQWTDLGLLNRLLLQEDYKKVSSISNNTQKALAMNPLKGKDFNPQITTKKRPASAIKWPCTQKWLQKVHMSPLKGKDFNTTAIDYRFSDLDYKLLKRDYKRGHRKASSKQQ
jgi:hypothetical protein